jgi:hypothetical protein
MQFLIKRLLTRDDIPTKLITPGYINTKFRYNINVHSEIMRNPFKC